jgi:hypothetical protein
MCNSGLKLSVLPAVLEQIVIDYAFNLPKVQVLDSLNIILSIREMNLPFFFFRPKIWSWEFAKFLPNPVFSFMPIEYYNGLYSELFDDDALYCLLLGLDFRRKNVRMFGTREQWLNRIVSSWRSIEPFAAYYKMLLRSRTPIMKHRSSFITRFL